VKLSKAKRASDVITQANLDKQNEVVKDLKPFFKRVSAKTIIKAKIWHLFTSYFSQSMLV